MCCPGGKGKKKKKGCCARTQMSTANGQFRIRPEPLTKTLIIINHVGGEVPIASSLRGPTLRVYIVKLLYP